jgi:hypothetical protein
VSDPSTAARRAEAAAWCQARAADLSAAIIASGPVATLPFPKYGDDCRRVQTWALEFKAFDLIPELAGVPDLLGHASMADALRQVRSLADWLAAEAAAGTAGAGGGESAADETRAAQTHAPAPDTAPTDSPPGETPAAATGQTVDTVPRPLLTGWRDITAALGMKWGDRKSIKSLNDRRGGPIRNRGRGTHPMVYKDDLVAWWNKLATEQAELANQREGAKLSAEAQHGFGRTGTAAPEVGGGVKGRRKDRRT